jgi:hypothetical protein
MTDVKQMKLLGGEEILCDLVDVQYSEEEGEAFVIRAAYSLISQEDFEQGFRYYTFRPFMMHVYDPSHILLLNSASVICMTNPSEPVVEQYIKHIEAFRKEEREKQQSSTEDFLEKMANEDEAKDDRIVKFKPKLH